MSVSFFVRTAGTGLKFLELFGKTSVRRLHRQRTLPHDPPDPERRNATARKIDTIESEIVAELGVAELMPSPARIEPAMLLEQRIEEACLLHAGGQSSAAEDVLAEATAVPLPAASERERLAWLMRLELACFDDNQQRFEDIALCYAQRFEASPPQWRSPPPDGKPRQSAVLAVRGRLCGNAAPQLAQLEKAAEHQALVQLDLGSVTEADAAGCRLLLGMLQRWQAERIEATVIGADMLLGLLQARIVEGRRDSDDTVWLLRIELLRATGNQAAYEEACIAYSLTYEVSPPVAPVAMPVGGGAPGCIALPRNIGLPLEGLLSSIAAACGSAPALLLDCSALQRVEFSAASPLLSGIMRVAHGKTVEWRDTSFLVSTLLQLVGGAGQLRIINRKP